MLSVLPPITSDYIRRGIAGLDGAGISANQPAHKDAAGGGDGAALNVAGAHFGAAGDGSGQSAEEGAAALQVGGDHSSVADDAAAVQGIEQPGVAGGGGEADGEVADGVALAVECRGVGVRGRADGRPDGLGVGGGYGYAIGGEVRIRCEFVAGASLGAAHSAGGAA